MIFGILFVVFLECMTRRWLQHLTSKTALKPPTGINHHHNEQNEIVTKEGWMKEGADATSMTTTTLTSASLWLAPPPS